MTHAATAVSALVGQETLPPMYADKRIFRSAIS